MFSDLFVLPVLIAKRAFIRYVLLLLILLTHNIVIADDTVHWEAPKEPEVIAQPREVGKTISEKVDFYADKWGVDRWLLHHIVKHESTYDPLAVGDTHYYKPSYGLVQINRYWNPQVSIEQAFDPDFALDWAGQQLAQGKCYLWSTCPLN